MAPPKKAAKKVAKKAAKKTHSHHHREADDLRRAYEHLGRVAVLRQSSDGSLTETIGELTTMAQRSMKDGERKDAADLLRAAEHLCFAVLAGEVSAVVEVSAELKQAITGKFDELLRRATEHWDERDHSESLSGIYMKCCKGAAKAFKARAYHQALEFARAAEALAHVKQDDDTGRLGSGRKNLQFENKA